MDDILMTTELSSKEEASQQKKNKLHIITQLSLPKQTGNRFPPWSEWLQGRLPLGLATRPGETPPFSLGDKQTLAPHPSMASERVPIPKKARIAFTIFI